jgi:hydroxyacylglutathione hydrolase
VKSWTTRNGTRVFRILSGRSNVFLISSSGRRWLVDSGPSRLWARLNRRIRSLGITSIEYLILTHAHFDHAGNAAKIKNEYGAKAIIHESEASFLTTGDNAPVSSPLALLRLVIRNLEKVLKGRMIYDPCDPDKLTREISYLSDEDRGCYILHTPGHTSGSQSVIVDSEIALVGDAMFGVFRGSVFPPYATDADLMVKSWQKLLDSGCTIFLPSHGTENTREMVAAGVKKHD